MWKSTGYACAVATQSWPFARTTPLKASAAAALAFLALLRFFFVAAAAAGPTASRLAATLLA